MPTLDPARLDVAALARRGARLRGRLAVAELDRLAVEARGDGEVSYELSFASAGGGRVELSGRIRARLELRCQRCLGRLALELDEPLAITIAPAGADRSGQAGRGADIELADGATVALPELIEDEVLLALPQVPRHQGERGCAVPERYRAAAIAPRRNAHPFAPLARLARR